AGAREVPRAPPRDVLRGSSAAPAARHGGPQAVAARPYDRLRRARARDRSVPHDRRMARARPRGRPPMSVDLDLGDLGLDEGGHLLIDRELRRHAAVEVRGTADTLIVDLPAWCRARGHTVTRTERGFAITRSPHDRWAGAERAGAVDHPVDHP